MNVAILQQAPRAGLADVVAAMRLEKSVGGKCLRGRGGP
jgi:hypothetical protein